MCICTKSVLDQACSRCEVWRHGPCNMACRQYTLSEHLSGVLNGTELYNVNKGRGRTGVVLLIKNSKYKWSCAWCHHRMHKRKRSGKKGNWSNTRPDSGFPLGTRKSGQPFPVVSRTEMIESRGLVETWTRSLFPELPHHYYTFFPCLTSGFGLVAVWGKTKALLAGE